MKYEQVIYGSFIKRLNRFIAEVEIDGEIEQVHVKNTGRLKELLLKGSRVALEVSNNPKRKTKYSLIAVEREGTWVNIDSQAPNAVVFEAINEGHIKEIPSVQMLKREVTYGDSRFDLYYESDNGNGFIEVKGVTLQKDGIAMFPDAPTSRGTKHILEMIKAVEEGFLGTIFFLVTINDCTDFSPNKEMDEPFAEALRSAKHIGVQVLAYTANMNGNSLQIGEKINVFL